MWSPSFRCLETCLIGRIRGQVWASLEVVSVGVRFSISHPSLVIQFGCPMLGRSMLRPTDTLETIETTH
jgi:hypothetical protein